MAKSSTNYFNTVRSAATARSRGEPSAVNTLLKEGVLHPTRSSAATKKPAAPPAETDGRLEADTFVCACIQALDIFSRKRPPSRTVLTHDIIGRLIASKAGSQRAVARRAVTNRPANVPMVRAADFRMSRTVPNRGMATEAPY